MLRQIMAAAGTFYRNDRHAGAIIDGQPGAGKTALIEQLLESNKSRSIQASRCLRQPGLGKWKEEWASDSGRRNSRHTELHRWLDAGGFAATLLMYNWSRFP